MPRRLLTALTLLALAAPAASAELTLDGREVQGTEGAELDATVASGSTNRGATACLRAEIAWGDGTTTTGTIPAGAKDFTVHGRHTYAKAGTPDLVTTVRDECASDSASAHSGVTIADAPLSAQGRDFKAFARYPANVVVATFTDANALAEASDFSATVDWGNGRSGPGAVSPAPGGGFQVAATVTYPNPDVYPVSVAIADAGGSSATAAGTAPVTPAPPPAELLATGGPPGHAPLAGAYAPNGDLLLRLRAYPDSLRSGVRVASGDVNGDGAADVITAPGRGGHARIKVFSGANGRRIGSFRAFGSDAGVYVAAGDVDGDGKADIVAGAGEGARPRVRVFSGADGHRLGAFFARRHGSRAGVRVAAGDIDGDGKAEIAAAGGRGAATLVRLFREDGERVATLRPKGLRARRGLSLAMGDVNDDGLADFVLGGDDRVDVDGADGRRITRLRPFPGTHHAGLRVAVADLDADGVPEVAVARARPGERLRAFRSAGWTRLDPLLGGHPPQGALYLG